MTATVPADPAAAPDPVTRAAHPTPPGPCWTDDGAAPEHEETR